MYVPIKHKSTFPASWPQIHFCHSIQGSWFCVFFGIFFSNFHLSSSDQPSQKLLLSSSRCSCHHKVPSLSHRGSIWSRVSLSCIFQYFQPIAIQQSPPRKFASDLCVSDPPCPQKLHSVLPPFLQSTTCSFTFNRCTCFFFAAAACVAFFFQWSPSEPRWFRFYFSLWNGYHSISSNLPHI